MTIVAKYVIGKKLRIKERKLSIKIMKEISKKE